MSYLISCSLKTIRTEVENINFPEIFSKLEIKTLQKLLQEAEQNFLKAEKEFSELRGENLQTKALLQKRSEAEQTMNFHKSFEIPELNNLIKKAIRNCLDLSKLDSKFNIRIDGNLCEEEFNITCLRLNILDLKIFLETLVEKLDKELDIYLSEDKEFEKYKQGILKTPPQTPEWIAKFRENIRKCKEASVLDLQSQKRKTERLLDEQIEKYSMANKQKSFSEVKSGELLNIFEKVEVLQAGESLEQDIVEKTRDLTLKILLAKSLDDYFNSNKELCRLHRINMELEELKELKEQNFRVIKLNSSYEKLHNKYSSHKEKS